MKASLIYWSHRWQTRKEEMLLSRKHYILQQKAVFTLDFKSKWFLEIWVTSSVRVISHQRAYFDKTKSQPFITELTQQNECFLLGLTDPVFFFQTPIWKTKAETWILYGMESKGLGVLAPRRQTPFRTGRLSGFNKRSLIRRDAASREGLSQKKFTSQMTAHSMV